jgi:16S rRNA U516 pseudouridylate synthase RsuA-like enzyme
LNRYILYNKPKKIDLNNIPVHLAKAFSKFFKGFPYSAISLDTNYSGLVLFYQDETFDIEKRSKKIKVLLDIQFKNDLKNDEIKKITEDILSVDKNSNFAFKSSELGIETTLYFQNSITEILKKIDSLNIDRVLISNLDKFEIPRGNYRVLKDIEVFNFKSLSHSPNKTPS